MKIFENIASLKLASLTLNQLVRTKGYYTANDGGGALYYIVASQAADEYGDHTTANTNIAVLHTLTPLNVRQYGAVMDGVADDSAAFIAADAASSESTYVPVGDYDLTSGTFTGLKFHSFGTPNIVSGTITILDLNP